MCRPPGQLKLENEEPRKEVNIQRMEGLSQLGDELAICIGKDTGSNLVVYYLQRLMPAHKPDFVSVAVMLPGRNKLVTVSNLVGTGSTRLCIVGCGQSAAGHALHSGMFVMERAGARRSWRDARATHDVHGVQVLAAAPISSAGPEEGFQGVLTFGWKSKLVPQDSSLHVLQGLASALATRLAAHTAELVSDVVTHFLPGSKQVEDPQSLMPEDNKRRPAGGPGPGGAPSRSTSHTLPSDITASAKDITPAPHTAKSSGRTSSESTKTSAKEVTPSPQQASAEAPEDVNSPGNLWTRSVVAGVELQNAAKDPAGTSEGGAAGAEKGCESGPAADEKLQGKLGAVRGPAADEKLQGKLGAVWQLAADEKLQGKLGEKLAGVVQGPASAGMDDVNFGGEGKQKGKNTREAPLVVPQRLLLEFQDGQVEGIYARWEAFHGVRVDACAIATMFFFGLFNLSNSFFGQQQPSTADKIVMFGQLLVALYMLLNLKACRNWYIDHRESMAASLLICFHFSVLRWAYLDATTHSDERTSWPIVITMPLLQSLPALLFKIRYRRALLVQTAVIAASLAMLSHLHTTGDLCEASLYLGAAAELVIAGAAPCCLNFMKERRERKYFVKQLQLGVGSVTV